ncbi:glycosyltransferase family 4 protein [Thermotoga profunda]|uniref:glycosyltransferase family 4 protein n=1 Tax=Thermotoga profunda TaxID=1508420 RepID=UPI000596F33E|nr:MraY family glycosyltransferase [Thermotoga profunda]
MSFVISFCLSLIFVRFFAQKFPVDLPSSRKIHKVPIPLTGGIAIFVALLFVENQTKMVLLICFAFLFGILDDIEELSYKIKLPFQLIIAIVQLIIGPSEIYFLSIPLHGIFAKTIQTFWFMSMFNALNMIDGMDALACSTSMISAFLIGEWRLGFAIAGFLPFNLPKAKSFLGNSGSAILGAVLPISVLVFFKGDIGYATIFLGYPAYEVVSSFLRRIVRHKNPFVADKNHTHHLFMKKIGVWRTLIFLIIFSFLCNLLGLAEKFWSFAIFLAICVSLFIYCFSKSGNSNLDL